MFIKPKKSSEIYSLVIAHRGMHDIYPENSMSAYNRAIKNKYAIEMDIRLTKDKKIVCFHDRYTKRLIGIWGKVASKSYNNLKQYYIKNTNETIPLFEEVLKNIDGRVAILIEVKGLLTKSFKDELIKLLNNYNGKYYFHVKNVLTYYILKNIYKDRVFYILNPLRKRFNLIKNR